MSLKSYVTVNEKKQLEIKIETYKLWSGKKLPLNKMALNAQQLQNVLDSIIDPNSNALSALLSGLLAKKEQIVKMRNESTDLRLPLLYKRDILRKTVQFSKKF